jgi:hypothetical protein
MRKIYVDTENVSDYSALETIGLNSKDEVILFMTDHSKPLKADTLMIITKSRAKLDVVKIKTNGRLNALDFRIVAHLSHKFTKKNEYVIFSSDNGYESAIEHFLEEGYTNITILKEAASTAKKKKKKKKKSSTLKSIDEVAITLEDEVILNEPCLNLSDNTVKNSSSDDACEFILGKSKNRITLDTSDITIFNENSKEPNELEIQRIKKSSKSKAEFHNTLRDAYGDLGVLIYKKHRSSFGH